MKADRSFDPKVTSTTAFVGVIGDPVAHSVSPRLHNRAYHELGADLCYGAFRVPSGGARDAIAGARALGFRGLSVTTPHKQDAARYADQRSGEVEALGAANTIVYYGSVATALTTDGPGLVFDLEANCSFDPRGRRCGVLGAGGSARAVAMTLVANGASEVLIVNRNEQRARDAAAICGASAHAANFEELDGVALLVNATSISLGASGPPQGDDAQFLERATEHLRAGQLVVDLTYFPPRSPFLELAAKRGASVRNGLGMLVHQAALQVELFTGEKAPIEAMWAEVAEISTGS